MQEQAGKVQFDRLGEALVMTPHGSVGDLDLLGSDQIRRAVLEALADETVRHLVVDLGSIDYFGSILLGILVQAWRIISARGGRMAICDASDEERTLLATTRLDSIWLIAATRDEALERVRSESS